MKINLGCKTTTLIFHLCLLLIPFELKAEQPASATEIDSISSNDISTNNAIEEGWVEKKIAPSTQWIESLFSPFTQWMEDEIQQQPDTQATSYADPNSSHRLISIKQAIDTALKHNQGKILRTQFKTGPPPYYKIKILSDKGTVSILNVHAFSGDLFTPSLNKIKQKEVKP